MSGRNAAYRFGLYGALGAMSLLLAAFFLFVGYMKASAPLPELALHGAWTVHLPEAAGRAVGVSEMALALALLAGLARPGAGAVAALILVLNQIAAAAVHAGSGESAALPQNAVLIALCLAVAGLQRVRMRRAGAPSPVA
ncbi:hypothetical protein SAMIE_1021720 [Sphingobium amiense]|uniref:DoxX family protein n=1 Tax=Sphingobium amiense TaxID=135719 RepID=A0A494W375_9SPHN|nr:DoxX family protein [Sphingobium amiense]BBD98671.1 hypothetical protein SAMIE_1021720 [Sphingobium amiense]